MTLIEFLREAHSHGLYCRMCPTDPNLVLAHKIIAVQGPVQQIENYGSFNVQTGAVEWSDRIKASDSFRKMQEDQRAFGSPFGR